MEICQGGCPAKVSNWVKEGISQRRYQGVKGNTEGAGEIYKLFRRQQEPKHSTKLGFNGRVEEIPFGVWQDVWWILGKHVESSAG